MANGLLLRLRERELSASPAERNVIAYVSAHPHEVVGLSVRGLADVTFSSPSSILRFCKRLGFAGYKEFQRELIAELALLGDKKDVALEDISMDDSVERIVGKVMKSNVRTIEATARTTCESVDSRTRILSLAWRQAVVLLMWWAALCTPRQLGARPLQLPATKGRRSGRAQILPLSPCPVPRC